MPRGAERRQAPGRQTGAQKSALARRGARLAIDALASRRSTCGSLTPLALSVISPGPGFLVCRLLLPLALAPVPLARWSRLGRGAPKNTPAEIIEKLNKEINAALTDPKMKARLADPGATVLPGSPTDFGKLIADETEKWAKVINFLGIKPQ